MLAMSKTYIFKPSQKNTLLCNTGTQSNLSGCSLANLAAQPDTLMAIYICRAVYLAVRLLSLEHWRPFISIRPLTRLSKILVLDTKDQSDLSDLPIQNTGSGCSLASQSAQSETPNTGHIFPAAHLPVWQLSLRNWRPVIFVRLLTGQFACSVWDTEDQLDPSGCSLASMIQPKLRS